MHDNAWNKGITIKTISEKSNENLDVSRTKAMRREVIYRSSQSIVAAIVNFLTQGFRSKRRTCR
jgi:hypothetical protein